MRVPLYLCIAALALTGCSAPDEVQIAENEVAKFHKMFNANEFEDLYAAAADHLKKHTSDKDFVSILDSWYRDLGAEVRSERTGWTVEANTKDGKLVTVKYRTLFANSYADEEFTYEIHSRKALLGHFIFHKKTLEK